MYHANPNLINTYCRTPTYTILLLILLIFCGGMACLISTCFLFCQLILQKLEVELIPPTQKFFTPKASQNFGRLQNAQLLTHVKSTPGKFKSILFNFLSFVNKIAISRSSLFSFVLLTM